MDKSQILIVEDDPDSSELLHDMLAMEGYSSLHIATNGTMALSHVAKDPPDLILLDVMMPGMSGFDVCQRLKNDPETASIPIILVTALGDRANRLRGLEAGADDFITKPIDEPELLVRTRSLLHTKRLHDDLVKAMQAKVEFIGQISHELRSPLFAITGLTEMLLDGEVVDPVRVQHYIRTIHDQSGFLVRLVDDLLDLSRFDRGIFTLNQKPFQIAPFLDDTLTLMQPRAQGRSISLQLDVRNPDMIILADEGRLRQVVINLLNNALCYNDPGGWVRLSAQQEAHWGVIAVEDNGWGIPKTDLPNIFERFYRGENVQVNSEQRGTGLGLALAREIVRAHDGKITAESAGITGKGSTLRVYLPIEEAG